MRLANVADLAEASVHDISGRERQRVLSVRSRRNRILLTKRPQPRYKPPIGSSTSSGPHRYVALISVFHDTNLAAYYSCSKKGRRRRRTRYVLTRENLNAVYGIDTLVETHP